MRTASVSYISVMSRSVHVALVGDYDPAVTAHQAIPCALALAADVLGVDVEPHWLPTDGVRADNPLAGAHAVWCVPASPYRSTEGALRAIRAARETGRPFLGTCGGFQHAILEYARAVLGWADAEHGETSPDAAQQVITPLACALVEANDMVRFAPGSRLAVAYGTLESREGYRCRYGLNPAVARELTAGPLRATATDATGEVRAVELDGHPFFVATLFQPERAALAGTTPPLALALVRAAIASTSVRGRGAGGTHARVDGEMAPGMRRTGGVYPERA
jgi:CTP synthase (UTP-ammonia lyase)